jgi:dTDP-glucose 4,6-dehydratase
VCGGAGFLGSHLCEALLDRGYGVVCVDDLSTGSMANVRSVIGTAGFELVEADITEGLHVPGLFDLVFHLASPASPRDYLRMPLASLRAGSIGTFHALDLARHCGARLILASTSEVYGDPTEHPQKESYRGNVSPTGRRSVYNEAKRFSEAAVTAYRREYGSSTAIVRIFNTYGPRMRADDGRAVPTFIRQALANEPVTVTGDGTQTRSFCYVDDLISGLVHMATSNQWGPINLGNPTEGTILDLARLVISLTGSSSSIEFIDRPADDPCVRCPDIALAQDRLGWQPSTSLVEGLTETIEWYQDGAHAVG